MGYVFLDINELSNNAIITKKNIPLKNCKSGEINFSSNFTKQAEDIKTESVKKDDQTDKIEELSAIKETSLSSEEKESKVSLDIESTSETEKLQDTNSEFEKTEKSLYTEKTTETKKQEIKENKKDESFVSKVDEDNSKKSLSSMVFGHLTLTIHNGVNLMNTELIGKSDPYVVIEHGGQNFRSKTVKNSQNPIWDFVVDTDIKKESAENIKVSVFDEDIGKDDPMGYVFLDINELSNNAIITKKNIPLKNCKSGEINFSSNFTKQAKDLKIESVKKDDQSDMIEELSAIKETSLSSEEKGSKGSLEIESTGETENLQDVNSEFEKTEKSLYI